MCDENEIEDFKLKWLQEQEIIKGKISLEDERSDWLETLDSMLIGGLDISFIVGDDVNACACYVVLDSTGSLVYNKVEMVQMDSPYIPGFLAFRESKFLTKLVVEQLADRPEVTPSIILVDGNGILHPNRAGIASHLGVELGIPTIGVAKNIHLVDELGDFNKKQMVESLTGKGSRFDLKSVKTGETLGCALKSSESGQNPVFISVGTGISLDTAVKVVLHFSKHRIPEPTRQADIISREYLRVHHPTERQRQPVKKCKQKKTIKD